MTTGLSPWMHTLVRVYSGAWPIECALVISARDVNGCLVPARSFAYFNPRRPSA